jgi:DNA (cytosine-5)-methyltransferase 1
MRVATSPLNSLDLLSACGPDGWYGRTSPACCRLTTDGTFGAFLGILGQLGYGFAYRVLDAQYFGVPQRRRRVFVVGHLGDWRRAAAVLFERHSLSGHPAPRREARERTTRGVEVGPSGGSFTETSPTLDARCKDGFIRNQLGVGAVELPEVVGTLSDGAHMGGGLTGRTPTPEESSLAHA